MRIIKKQSDVITEMMGTHRGAQNELAEKLGEKPNVIWSVKTGKRKITFGKLLDWCRIAGYDLILKKKK